EHGRSTRQAQRAALRNFRAGEVYRASRLRPDEFSADAASATAHTDPTNACRGFYRFTIPPTLKEESIMSLRTEPPLDVELLRADFPILATQVYGNKPLVYLDNAASTQRPRQVTEALAYVDQHAYANVHRSAHY